MFLSWSLQVSKDRVELVAMLKISCMAEHDRWKSRCRGCTLLSMDINTRIEVHIKLLKENKILVPVGEH